MAAKNGQSTLKKLPLSEIQASPVALRVVDTKKLSYAELVDSIKVMGVLNPIIVREMKAPETGKLFYSVVDGLHRYTAAKDAGLSEIPCHIMNLEEGRVHEAQIIANVQKIETKKVEYAKLLERVLTGNPLLTEAELAQKLGKSSGWLHDVLSLTKIEDKQIQELVNEGKIKLYNAYALSKLPAEEQKNFLDRAMTLSPSEFVPMAHTRVKEIKDAKRKGKNAPAEQWIAHPKLRTTKELKAEIDTLGEGKSMLNLLNVKDPVSAWQLALNWAIQLDPKSVEVRKNAEDQRKKDMEEKKQKAKEERMAQRAREAAEAVASIS